MEALIVFDGTQTIYAPISVNHVGAEIWPRSKNSSQFPKGRAAYVHQMYLKIPT